MSRTTQSPVVFYFCFLGFFGCVSPSSAKGKELSAGEELAPHDAVSNNGVTMTC